MWNPVAAGAEHAVERPASSVERAARFGGDDLLDQIVDDGIGDPREVARPLSGRRLRRKEGPHAIARRGRQGKPLRGHVEIEGVDARAILHRIDQARRTGLDAKDAKALDEGLVMRLEARLVEFPFGEKYFITPTSVSRHIAFLKELRQAAADRGEPRPVVASDTEAIPQSTEDRPATTT